MKKHIIIFLVAIALVGGGLLALDRTSTLTGFAFPADLSEKSRTILNTAGSIVRSGSRKAADTADTAVKEGTAYISKKTSSATQSIADEISESLREIAAETLQATTNAIGDQIGVSSGGSETIVPSPISYVVSIGMETTFGITPSFLTDISAFDLFIDWGDGKTESHEELKANTVPAFPHTWEETGEYEFRFIVTAGDIAKTYTGHITVIE